MIKNDLSNTAKIVHPETTTVLPTKRSTRRLILGRFQRGSEEALVSLSLSVKNNQHRANILHQQKMTTIRIKENR